MNYEVAAVYTTVSVQNAFIVDLIRVVTTFRRARAWLRVNTHDM